jgi:hypothetical protein
MFVRALFVFTIFAASVAPEYADARFKYRKVKKLGEGVNSRAYEVKHNSRRHKDLTVLKKVKRSSSRRFVTHADRSKRIQLTNEAVDTARKLRSDQKLKRVIPRTASPEPGVLLQAKAHGLRRHQLSSHARARAEREMREAVRRAQAMMPGVSFSADPKNFRFSSDGHLTSWFDFMRHGRHRR